MNVENEEVIIHLVLGVQEKILATMIQMLLQMMVHVYIQKKTMIAMEIVLQMKTVLESVEEMLNLMSVVYAKVTIHLVLGVQIQKLITMIQRPPSMMTHANIQRMNLILNLQSIIPENLTLLFYKILLLLLIVGMKLEFLMPMELLKLQIQGKLFSMERFQQAQGRGMVDSLRLVQLCLLIYLILMVQHSMVQQMEILLC